MTTMTATTETDTTITAPGNDNCPATTTAVIAENVDADNDTRSDSGNDVSMEVFDIRNMAQCIILPGSRFIPPLAILVPNSPTSDEHPTSDEQEQDQE